MNVKEQFHAYKQWVIKNPLKASELESLVKWGSYILAGRFKNSGLLCEIVYAGSKLFELFNDYLVAGKIPQFTFNEFNKLKVLLTVVEYVEVVIEVSASQLWGEWGRWAVIALIQLSKAIWRLLLLLQSKVKLIPSPPLKSIDRVQTLKSVSENGCSNGFRNGTRKGIIRLPRSGRLIRTLDGTPPTHMRTFCPPILEELEEISPSGTGIVSFNNLVAEALHIFRPIGHLGSLWMFGQKSWVPWCLAFGIDLTSLHLHSQTVLTKEEKRELVYRRLSLLYYLVRTPAFQSITQRRIRQFLIAAGNNVPLARTVCQPLLDYIPEWQKIYSYTWH